VVGVQALRLEYYELFSHMFVEEGHAFAPWHVAIATADETKEKSWASG
jgi:V/A-type H+-transporting ATPase subunit I